MPLSVLHVAPRLECFNRLYVIQAWDVISRLHSLPHGTELPLEIEFLIFFSLLFFADWSGGRLNWRRSGERGIELLAGSRDGRRRGE